MRACGRTHRWAGAAWPAARHVIGAGATGTELAAELHRTLRHVVATGLDKIDPDKDIRITLVKAADRCSRRCPSAFPPRSCSCCADRRRCAPEGARDGSAADGVALADGTFLPSELVVWAAGVKAPPFLQNIGGWRPRVPTSLW